MALFEIDESSGLPVWVQLRNRFVYLIKTGHYQPGDQLPSVRTLAAEAAINYNTVSKVYINLEHDGYVESVRGKSSCFSFKCFSFKSKWLSNCSSISKNWNWDDA